MFPTIKFLILCDIVPINPFPLSTPLTLSFLQPHSLPPSGNVSLPPSLSKSLSVGNSLPQQSIAVSPSASSSLSSPATPLPNHLLQAAVRVFALQVLANTPQPSSLGVVHPQPSSSGVVHPQPSSSSVVGGSNSTVHQKDNGKQDPTVGTKRKLPSSFGKGESSEGSKPKTKNKRFW